MPFVDRAEREAVKTMLEEMLHGPDPAEDWEFDLRFAMSKSDAVALLRMLDMWRDDDT